MSLEDVIDLIVFMLSLVAVGIGIGCALSPAWASAAVGLILVVAVLLERFTLRLINKQRKAEANEPA